MSFRIVTGDCLRVMAEMEPDSIDAIVTDPPYGLSFMGKDWDHGIPGAHFWQEAIRVAKPGAHLLAFGGTRTFHRLTCAIEDAGWEIRDCIMWVYGSGFPKSLDVSKAIDRANGCERERERCDGLGSSRSFADDEWTQKNQGQRIVDAPITDDARQWQGWGTALKPAWEPIIVARKPLAGTVAENVLKHGTGAMNIDACRVDITDGAKMARNNKPGDNGWKNSSGGPNAAALNGEPSGRWPANVIHDGSDEVVRLMPEVEDGVAVQRHGGGQALFGGISGNRNTIGSRDDCGYGGSGSAARFFYCAKADRAEREIGCIGLPKKANEDWPQSMDGDDTRGAIARHNNHPTVKPVDLMQYLVRLVAPKGSTVLDPFTGSGSTGIAALRESCNFVGIELDPEYAEIARARIKGDAPLINLETP